MARRIRSDADSYSLSNVSNREFDGSIIGRRSGFRYATGGEKRDVRSIGVEMLCGRHNAKQRKKT